MAQFWSSFVTVPCPGENQHGKKREGERGRGRGRGKGRGRGRGRGREEERERGRDREGRREGGREREREKTTRQPIQCTAPLGRTSGCLQRARHRIPTRNSGGLDANSSRQKAGKQQRNTTWLPDPLFDENDDFLLGRLVKANNDLSNVYPFSYVFDGNLKASC